MNETYEGWSNQETWYIHLRVMNDRAAHDFVKARLDIAKFGSANSLQRFVQSMSSMKPSLFEGTADFGNSKSKINWEELRNEWNKNFDN